MNNNQHCADDFHHERIIIILLFFAASSFTTHRFPKIPLRGRAGGRARHCENSVQLQNPAIFYYSPLPKAGKREGAPLYKISRN